MDSCIFCQLIAQKQDEEFLFASDSVLAFDDVAPLAPVHVLIIPRAHIASMNDMTPAHQALLGEMLLTATSLARQKGIATEGYKLLIRTGKDGGQEVPHVHLHLIGGAPLAENIKVV